MPNEKIIDFDLNFIPQGVPPIVRVHQYDYGTIVTLRPTLYYGKDVYDGMDLSQCSVIVAYARPDGTKQSYNISPTVNQNVISFPLDTAMTAVWGPNVMSIGFQNGSNSSVLWTQNFILSLERHPIQAEDYVGSNAFEGMLQTLQQYVDTAYAATPPGYEEHIAKIQAVESAIDDLRDDIRESAEEANEYVDNKISGLDSIYQTLEDAQRAAEEGRAYAGTLVGDLGTQILSDMSLTYTTKDESNSQIAGLEIYAEQVSEASATELRERLGIEYTETGVDFVENGALSAEITKRANEIKQELSAEFVTEDAVEGVVSAYADSAITQKANEILLEVHQNYETKEDADDKLLTAQSYTDSQLSISSNQIRTEVNAYTDETIRNLKIGATNLLRGTNEYKTTDESQTWVPSYNNGGWAKTGTATVSELSDPPGNGFTTQVAMGNTAMLSQNNIDWFVDNKNYAAHMWIKKPISEDATGDQFLWFRNSTTGEKIPMSYTDADDNVISTITYRIHNPSHEEKAIPGDIAGNFIVDDDDILGLDDGSTTYTVEDEDSEWLELDVFFSNKEWPDLVDVVVGDGETAFTFAGLKIEEGNKITAWQPNEFDIKNYVNTSITQTNERISLLAEAQAVTDGTVNSMSSDFTVMAGKIDAMVEAGYIEPDGNQGWTSSYTAQLENRIYNSVSSTYATKDRVNAVESQIVTTDQYTEITSRAISNIKIGGENLLRATDLIKNKTTSNNATWSLADETHGWYQTSNDYVTLERIDISDPPSNGIKKAWKFTSSGGGTENSMICQQNVPVTYQQEYVVSCYARLVSGSADLHIASFKGSGMSHTVTYHELTSDWVKYKMVFTHDFASSKTQTNIFFGAIVANGVSCEVQICGMKLELGNMDTDWSPSVYDMEAYTQASLKVATDSITGTVSDLSGKYTELKQTVDGFDFSGFVTFENRFSPIHIAQYINTSYMFKHFATVKIDQAYANAPLSIEFRDRNNLYCQMTLGFANRNSLDPEVNKFYYTGTLTPYIYKSGTGEWQIWHRKAEGYGKTEVTGCYFPEDKFTITWVNIDASSLPSGYIEGTKDPDSVYTVYSSGTTTIDGSKITAGSIALTGLNTTTQTAINNALKGSIKRLYRRSSNNSQPAAPTSGAASGITASTNNVDTWSTTLPTFVQGSTYYWTCEEYQKNDGKYYYTNVSPFQSTIIDGAHIYSGSITLTRLDTSAQNKINNAATDASNALTKANSSVVESVTVYYCYDKTAPSQPSGSAITSTSTAADQWTLRMPDPVRNAYYYECTQQKLNNGNYTFTTVRRMSYQEGIAKWISSSDSTMIDGGHIYAKSVDTGALNLYGELQILQSKTGSTGGYVGFETGNNGVSDTNGMILRSTGSKSYDSFAKKNTWPSYIHVSDSGVVIRSAYLQLRQSGSQAVKIINDNGLNLKEYANTGGVKITTQSRDDDSVAADLTMFAKTLAFDCSSNNIYFNPHTSGDTIYFQRGKTANEAQIGSYSSNFTTGKTWWTHGWFQNVGTQSGGVVSLSDRRSKKDINYNIIDGDLIDALKPARFKMIGDTDDRYHFGLIAQDVLDIYPDLVGSWGDGEDQRYNLSYEAFIPFLISKCQKLQKQINELKGE